ncbi:MAG TPA: hypothetical protein PLO33_03270, partial [Kouleothrix sp.]|nr:hypothetical protein [Kouleothrix sp.]
MERRQRVAITIAVCLVVILVTIGFTDLITPNIAILASGGYVPLLGGGSGSSSGGLLDPAFLGAESERSGLANTLFDDPTAQAAEPTATAYIAAEAGPFGNSAQLEVEPTLIRPPVIASATPTVPSGSTAQPGSASPAAGGGSQPTSTSGTSASPGQPTDTGSTGILRRATPTSPPATSTPVLP